MHIYMYMCACACVCLRILLYLSFNTLSLLIWQLVIFFFPSRSFFQTFNSIFIQRRKRLRTGNKDEILTCLPYAWGHVRLWMPIRRHRSLFAALLQKMLNVYRPDDPPKIWPGEYTLDFFQCVRFLRLAKDFSAIDRLRLTISFLSFSISFLPFSFGTSMSNGLQSCPARSISAE